MLNHMHQEAVKAVTTICRNSLMMQCPSLERLFPMIDSNEFVCFVFFKAEDDTEVFTGGLEDGFFALLSKEMKAK